MEIAPAEIDERTRYKLLTGCIVPRPIAWVSTIDRDGQPNLAPYSFFNGVGSNPLALTISINHAGLRESGRKDTLANIEATGEFVVNIVTEATASAMNETAKGLAPGESEFLHAGLTPVSAKSVRAPRVAESPIAFECELYQTVPIGSGPGSSTLVIGLVRHLFVDDQIIDANYYIDLGVLKPIGRLAGNRYARQHDQFDMVRPQA